MKSVIRWAIDNTPAMNTLMVAVLLIGGASLWSMRREVFPEFDLEILLVSVPYPGATPEDCEKGICQKIEEAVQSIDGIKKMNSIAKENGGFVVLELEAETPDVQKVLNEVRGEIDRIPSFPLEAEDPEIKQIVLRRAAIRVGVIGPDDEGIETELALREMAEQVREDLLQLPSVSQANIVSTVPYQIDVEIPEATLRRYGLSLREVARIVRRENSDMPGGRMITDSEEVLLRGMNERSTGKEIEKIPLVADPTGVVLTVGDLGTVRDAFTDETSINRINGRPGLVISVEKTAKEDLLAIVEEVHGYIDTKSLPAGFELTTWADQSDIVVDRLQMLTKNGLYGMLLVFLVLAVFLEIRLAFWVALGVPLSMLGACAVLIYLDQTLNMLTMFAFLMALGILVDDAIVVGENVYAHRQRGAGALRAAIDGTCEVLPSVGASVTTTIVAFTPMFLVPGVMGKFIAVMPLAVIAMLIISLFEVTFILPCHLVHDDGHHGAGRARRRWSSLPRALHRGFLAVGAPVTLAVFAAAVAGVLAVAWFAPAAPWALASDEPVSVRAASAAIYTGLAAAVLFLAFSAVYPLRRLGDLFRWLNVHTDRLVRYLIDRWYTPSLRWSLNNPGIVCATAAATLILFVGLIQARIIPFVYFPKLDANSIKATVKFPDGTPEHVTRAATLDLERIIHEIDHEIDDEVETDLVISVHRVVGALPTSGNMTDEQGSGSHVGGVFVEIIETSQRNITSEEILARWREKSPTFPGIEMLTFTVEEMGPGGAPIEFKLLARPEKMGALEKATEACKAKLATYKGVTDIRDDSQPGKSEFRLTKATGKALEVTQADVDETVRASYYGEEVMRLQRGRHEVKLMVRYPREERESLSNFRDIRVRLGDGTERPLPELADVEVERRYSQINRLDQLRAITVTADVDRAAGGNAAKTIADLNSRFIPELLARSDMQGVRVRWEGQSEETGESIQGLLIGLVGALLVMFALLTLEFRSYVQPLMILIIIPFGAIGAIAGHWAMGLDVTIFSLFGMVALTGVVVNDSIVLIDFINTRVRDGIPIKEALVDAGRRRFRPVMLTSITTIAGLLPILTETSLQAQVLIPMANSICFGLLFATVLVLIVVPTTYLIYARITGIGAALTPSATLSIEPFEETTQVKRRLDERGAAEGRLDE